MSLALSCSVCFYIDYVVFGRLSGLLLASGVTVEVN